MKLVLFQGARGSVKALAIGIALSAAAAAGAALHADSPGLLDLASARGDVAGSNDLVVLVHGLGRSRFSMLPLQWALENDGYQVLNWGYSSTCCTVAELADELARRVDRVEVGDDARIHFVGHSLGNIIVRSLLASDPPDAVGRFVMLAPPNQGSRAAGIFLPIVGWLFPPLAELTSEPTSTAQSVPMPSGVEFGVIAGEHDGKVSLAESHLPGEREHVVVPSAHTFIMMRGDVRRLVANFLASGAFQADCDRSATESCFQKPS
jgi:hypothetical protein